MLERIHLEIIDQVDKHGTLTAAADALFLTQPALSHSMRKLQTQLGVELWVKDGRGLRLTQAGKYLLTVARRTLPQLNSAELKLRQFGKGERGTLRIGMECHPCYQWLLKVVEPFLEQWPDVDVDVKQKFQFGGIAAIFAHEIDLLVTPDPLYKPGLKFIPVFDYEQVLVVAKNHPLATYDHIMPQDLADQTVITYPVPQDRLDIFSLFMTPAGISPRNHKTIETTDIMLQMVACNRGVSALPKWLVQSYSSKIPVTCVRLGSTGIQKQIHLGIREQDLSTPYLNGFIKLAESLATEAD